MLASVASSASLPVPQGPRRRLRSEQDNNKKALQHPASTQQQQRTGEQSILHPQSLSSASLSHEGAEGGGSAFHGQGQEEGEEEEGVDGYSQMTPVDVLAKLPKDWTTKTLSAKKW